MFVNPMSRILIGMTTAKPPDLLPSTVLLAPSINNHQNEESLFVLTDLSQQEGLKETIYGRNGTYFLGQTWLLQGAQD
jgi:hypothetical protein